MNEITPKFCQCCGMPMGDNDGLNGTNADGSKNGDYCKYCFENGEFTFHGTMEEMIEICIPHMVAANPGLKEEEARKAMLEWFPTLKRWKE
ncbi:transcriptional regulator [Clostridiaceae bacterium]|nr:transcriptional regulator [Clostridiaceae bacterium]RKI16578.1 transcriptional regulator [bacterium 1XD21-70]